MKKFYKKWSSYAGYIGLYILALSYRGYGIADNHPFWVDEFSSAEQAKLLIRYGIGAFSNSAHYFESNNILTHALIALFFGIFGLHEWVARAPFVLIGSAAPILVYMLGRRIGDKWVGISAALLSTTSYYMITWSRQARSYTLLVDLALAALIVYHDYQHSPSRKKLILLVIISILGVASHTSYAILVIALITHWITQKKRHLKRLASSPFTYLAVALTITLAVLSGLPYNISDAINRGFIGSNNLWYYHAFLWREYTLITFVGLAGIMIYCINKKGSWLYLYYFALHLVFFNFIFKPYSSRYVLVLFPLLYIFTAYVFRLTLQSISRRDWIILIPVIFIIANGNKFDLKPNRYYSVNHDMREIALVDYNSMYSIITHRGQLKQGKTALIDTWWDRLRWYVGDDYQAVYAFRWDNAPGLINGLPRYTPYVVQNHNKIIPRSGGVQLVSNLKDLKRVMSLYPRGFIIIDDESMSHDVIIYAAAHMKVEWHANRYALDDNPYSDWPITLYSWGIK